MQMTAKRKFRADLIEQAHSALEAMPQHQPQEFTKAQAIQKLIGPIRAVQAKGYTLTAIAKVVSDIGIPVTPGALRLYTSGGKAADGAKRKVKAKRTDKQPVNAEPNAVAEKRGTPSTQPAKPAARPAATSADVDPEWDPTARLVNAALSPEGSPRAGFYVRPDREKI